MTTPAQKPLTPIKDLKAKFPGVPLHTVLILGTRDDLVVTQGGPVREGEGKGKYVGWITMPETQHYRPVLHTRPMFDTPEAATTFMQDLLAAAREYVVHPDARAEIPEFARQHIGLDAPTEESLAIGKIIAAAR